MLALVAGCGGDDGGGLRLGYFANLTHAVPIVGLDKGIYAEELPGVDIETRQSWPAPTP